MCYVPQAFTASRQSVSIPTYKPSWASKIHHALGAEKGMIRQLFKAVNGIDGAAQLWNMHYDNFMLQEGFLRSTRDNCIYFQPESTVQSSLYVDDVLASAAAHKKHELDKFVKRVQKQFPTSIH